MQIALYAVDREISAQMLCSDLNAHRQLAPVLYHKRPVRVALPHTG